jgi:hypothetical protein
MPKCLLIHRRAIAVALRSGALVGIGLALSVSAAWAQFTPPVQALKGNRTEVSKILREDQGVPPAQQEMFETYFRKYALAQFTAKENLTNLPKVRKDYRVYFSQPAGANGSAHAEVNKLSLEKFTEILRIKIRPDMPDDLQSQINAMKLNAVLAIGDLNEQEPGAGSKGKPLPESLTLLLKIFSPKPADGATTGALDALRAGAFLGIQRHAESDTLPPESRTSIRAAMLALVKQKEPPAGRDPVTHIALRRRAVETLGILDESQPSAPVIKAIAGILGDPTESTKMRATTASVLGSFKYTPDLGLNYKALVDQIGRFAVDSFNQELQTATKEGILPSRRRLKSWSHYAREGVGEPLKPTSLAALAGEAGQKIYAKLRALDATCDDPKVKDEMLTKNLNDKLKDLDSILPARGAGPKVAPNGPSDSPPLKEGTPVVKKKPDRVSGTAFQNDRPVQRVEPVSAEIKPGDQEQ